MDICFICIIEDNLYSLHIIDESILVIMKANLFFTLLLNSAKNKLSLGGLMFFLIFYCFCAPQDVRAEGSGDWGTATNRQSMLWVPASSGVQGYATRGSMMIPSTVTGYNPGHRLYVYVKQGETVFWGFRRGGSTGTIRVRWYYDASSSGFYPEGISGVGRTLGVSQDYDASAAGAATGRPSDGNAAHIGPSQITGNGYAAYTFINNTGADRAFWVEISNTNNSIITNGFNINFWDITVASGTEGNYVERSGRVYSRYWSVSNSRADISINNLTILNKGQADAYSFHDDFGFYVPIDNTYTSASDDYFVKRIRFPGSTGGWTNFFANQDGPRSNLSYEDNRKSITTASTSNYQYPLFINDPDPDIWKTTTPPSTTLDIVYREKISPASGGEANVNISISLPAIVDILIDINGNGEYDSDTDILLSRIYQNPGNYSVYWNGEDANGVELPSGGEVSFIASVAFFPVHFPIYDLEQCLGIHVTNIRPGVLGNDFIFWDDSLIPRSGVTPADSPQSVAINVTGLDSPEHIWWATGDNGFSNNITINTWTASYYRVVQRTSGFSFLTISGNVFEDLNGLEDHIVNGEGVNFENFYAVLINDKNNVISFASILSDGTYTINDVPNGTFSIFITTQAPIIGTIAPQMILPEWYESTGEFLGVGEGSSGEVNGVLSNIIINNASIDHANFGIRPIEYDLISSKEVDAINPKVGDHINFSITVENAGYSKASEVYLDEHMPSGYAYISHSVSQGTFNPLVSPAVWDIGTLGSRQVASLEVTVEVLDGNDYLNSVSVYSTSGVPEISYANNYNDVDTEPFRIMPVDWLSFNGKIERESTILEWSTAKERDSHFFIVQRSENSSKWVNLGKVMAQGNADQISNYKFIDESPLAGSNYYRLHQMDLDGKGDFSKVIRVNFNPKWSIRTYPNPFKNEIIIDIKDLNGVVVTLMDMNGAIIQMIDEEQSLNRIRLKTDHLLKGIYFLRIQSESQSIVNKLVKF